MVGESGGTFHLCKAFCGMGRHLELDTGSALFGSYRVRLFCFFTMRWWTVEWYRSLTFSRFCYVVELLEYSLKIGTCGRLNIDYVSYH